MLRPANENLPKGTIGLRIQMLDTIGEQIELNGLGVHHPRFIPQERGA